MPSVLDSPVKSVLEAALNLREQSPRSPYETLGLYVVLPRTIDKCRADIAGQAGDYQWYCILTKKLFDFKGINPEDFRTQVASGKSDQALLQWVDQNGFWRSEEEILSWSYDCRTLTPRDVPMKAMMERMVRQLGDQGKAVQTYFQLLDALENRAI